MRRRKQVEMDGARFTISPLTLEQVGVLGDDGEVRPVPKSVYETVVDGLNNGQLAIAEDLCGAGLTAVPWTVQRVKSEMDLLLWKFLHAEILDFSGLKIEAKSAGETEAPAPVAP